MVLQNLHIIGNSSLGSSSWSPSLRDSEKLSQGRSSRSKPDVSSRFPRLMEIIKEEAEQLHAEAMWFPGE